MAVLGIFISEGCSPVDIRNGSPPFMSRGEAPVKARAEAVCRHIFTDSYCRIDQNFTNSYGVYKKHNNIMRKFVYSKIKILRCALEHFCTVDPAILASLFQVIGLSDISRPNPIRGFATAPSTGTRGTWRTCL